MAAPTHTAKKRSTAFPLLKVVLVAKVGRKGKVKIRFDDGPHPGLEEYVTTRQLVSTWGERKAVLRDEERTARLLGHARAAADKAVAGAASAVLESTGEPGAYVAELVTSMHEDELQRICDRAGIDITPADLHPLGFRDRRRNVHLPLDGMVRLAQAFAAAEPNTVTLYLDGEEEELRLKGNMPGERWYHQYLREQGPAFALARRWAGLQQEADPLRQEIGRLRTLVSRAAGDLSAAGQDIKARRLLRALEGRSRRTAASRRPAR